MVSSGLATQRAPLAIASLLLYQQPSSTTLYYSYQEHLFLTKARLRNETGEITDITFLTPQRVSFVLRLRQSFPEDCARLKLSSARASQAGLREMMTRRRVRAVVTSNPGKRRLPVLLVQRGAIRRREITNPALMLSYWYDLFPPR